MVGKTDNVLVEFDYQNIILVDPNKLINDEGKAEERLVDHENLVMYANLTCKLLPRTKLAIGADIQNSIKEVTLAEINFLSQQNLDGKKVLTNLYTDEMTGKNSLQGDAINQNKNLLFKKPLSNGETNTIIEQRTQSLGQTGSINTGLLGITNITIKNSTSFVPTVTIEFEDVRGRALFERGDQSPYAAFFHMPYPIFYLTIKGFYGKAIRYPLQLHTFNTRFNTMTGNYQVTCVFYSYKYGVLADLSMGALYGLPYMYQSEYTKTNGSKTETIQTYKGTQKLKEVYSAYKSKGLIDSSFPEINIQQLVHKIETFEDLVKKEMGQQDMGSLTDVDTYRQNIKNFRLSIYSVGNNSWFDKYIDQDLYVFDKNKVKIFFYKPDIERDPTKATTELQSLIDEYSAKLASNKTFGKNGTFDGQSFEIPNPIIVQTFEYGSIDLEKTIDYRYTFERRKNRQPFSDDELNIFIEEVKKELKPVSTSSTILGFTKPGIFFDGTIPQTNNVTRKGFVNELSTMLGKDGLEKKKEKIENSLTEKLSKILESSQNGLGFRPTIRNISAVIFACGEAFLRLLDDTHKKAWDVRNNVARKNAILKNSQAKTPEDKNFIDELNLTGDATKYPVYPWPQFFSERKDEKGNTRFELTYPADDSVIDKTEANDYNVWPEVEFEEEFIKSMIYRNQPPLPYTDNGTTQSSKISLNSFEFPIGNTPYSNKQITKFIYEIWERFIVATSFNGFYDKNLSDVFAELETVSLKSEGITNDPFLTNVLKDFANSGRFTSAGMESILQEISNDGLGESYQLYARGLFATPYIRNKFDHSFVILGGEYYNDSSSNVAVSLDKPYFDKLNDFMSATTKNVVNTLLTDIYPFSNSDWVKKNTSPSNAKDIYSTNNVLKYSEDKKLIANFKNTSQSKSLIRPYTNLTFKNGELPTITNLQGATIISNDTVSNFYQKRFDDTSTSKGQLVTEGKITYTNYTNKVSSVQTTSMLNTPFFVNAIEKGVDKYYGGTYTESNPPFVEAAYLFLNSLPLSTLREKYINIDNNQITDLDYLFACFKKHSALHKLPYAWVLKYGSIWHRYKKWVETGNDFLSDVWVNYDYKKKWDPLNTNVTFWNVGNSNIYLNNKTGNDREMGLGFYPETINNFNYFHQYDFPFSGYSQQDISGAFTSNKLKLISGSSSSDKNYGSGYTKTDQNETLSVKNYTLLSKTNSPIKGVYVLPSVGSFYNQIYDECFTGTTMVTPLSGNNSMYNGSVRNFLGAPNFGYFDADKISKPSPKQYIKQILQGNARQESFSFGNSSNYSSIEEIFAVFDKEALDQFEIHFLKWCKASYDSDSKLPINNNQIPNSGSVLPNTQTINLIYNNFQQLFTNLMFVADTDVSSTAIDGDPETAIRQIQNIQYRNIGNLITGFFEYDVIIKYGNPTFFNRRLFLSVLNSRSSNPNYPIIDPINFGFYGDNFSDVLPNISTNTRIALETYVGFSTISGVEYTPTSSYIYDFFVDLNFSLNPQNVQILAPIIKIYVTQKLKNQTYNAINLLLDLEVYFNDISSLRNQAFDIFATKFRTELNTISNVKKILTNAAQLQGNQTRTEIWETFKALNDKWVAGNDYNNRTLFEDVLFLDRASRDIGDKVFIDIYRLRSMLKDVNMDGRAMGFLLDLYTFNNFVSMSVPAYVNFYNVQDAGTSITPRIEGTTEFANNLFGTHLSVDIQSSSPKLVCFFVDKVSEHLEIENSEYRWGSDSFDLRRFSESPLLENQINKNDWFRSNKVVGFNVDVGIRNQNIFHNIILSQDPGKATSEGLRILDGMANSASGKQTATQNISLFNLYKTRSYSCTVQSMGNAMIQPTMYFNLRHVPMFNGPYMILNVEHTISPGNFTTNFTGVRISKFSFPVVQDFIQNIYKIYLSKFIEDIRNEIARDVKQRSNAQTVLAEKISNVEEKQKTLADCEPKNDNNKSKFVLTNNDIYTNFISYSDSEIKNLLQGITDVKTKILVYSAIYVSSFKQESYSAPANNLIGFSLDNPIKGNLSTHLINEYACVKMGNDRQPFAIFKDVGEMVDFAKSWFGPYVSEMTGSVTSEEFIDKTFKTYSKYWQTTTDENSVMSYINSYNGKLTREEFAKANKRYFSLFPNDKS